MRRPQSGSTLIELLIVIGLLCLMTACLTPNVGRAQDAANALADQANLRRHFEWLQVYKSKHNGKLPMEGGYKFVMSTWTANVFDHTPENFDRFWVPGPARTTDSHCAALRKMVERGENPWPNLAQTTCSDTHYVGRGKQHFKTREKSAEEAWMADDNEGGWSLRDGTVNVLFHGGAVRTYSYRQLQEQYGVAPFDRNNPMRTWGPDSPIEACQKLDN